MAADEPLSAIKPSEYIQLLSVCEWLYVNGTTTHNAEEMNGSFSQQYNDGEGVCSDKELGQQVGLFQEREKK